MIVSFRDPEAEQIWSGSISRKLPTEIQRIARRKLIQLDSATSLNDLRSPPGSRLHALDGSRAGQHSISINMQWRICFVWESGSALNVEIVDYH